MTAKVLIATAWYPTKSRHFGAYSSSVAALLGHPEYDSDLFITTSFGETKFESITRSMRQAQQWAEAHDYTHVFNIEADICVERETIAKLLHRDKPVVYVSSGGSGFHQLGVYNSGRGPTKGWGAVLVQTAALQDVPFDSYMGPWAWPDRMWLKRLNQLGVEVWIDQDIGVQVLENPSTIVESCFNPNTEEAQSGQTT